MKVSAQSIRVGNIIVVDDDLYLVLLAKSNHPGKGMPTTKCDMRRLSDGVKISKRWKTTDMVDRAFLDETTHIYLYEENDGYVFMNTKTYDQVVVPKEVVGSKAIYLQSQMNVQIAMFGKTPITVGLPQKVVLTVMETEPVTKGQTATSSYKPALLSNGVRTSVPPHVNEGTKIFIVTEDGSYYGIAKN